MESLRALIIHNVVSMRATPAGDSEQVSQAILGDAVLLLEEGGEYARVQTADAYEGWIWRRHLRVFEPGDAVEGGEGEGSAPCLCCVARPFADLFSEPGGASPPQTKLVFGTRVQTREQGWQGTDGYVPVFIPEGAPAGDLQGYVRADTLTPIAELPPFSGRAACEMGYAFIGTPYLWGGTTPFGFDCSGFVQRLYAMLGVMLPRDAYLQAQSPLGALLAPEERRDAGDLVFFQGERDPRHRGITHVGMALDDQWFIHAVGKEGVTITAFDDPYLQRIYTYRGAWRCHVPTRTIGV